MLEKVNSLAEQVKAFASKVVGLALPVAGALVAVEVLFGIKFGVIQRAASMVGMKPMNLIVGAIIVYLVVKK